MNEVKRFINQHLNRATKDMPALSLFSGAGLSDLGYELAGLDFKIQCELEKNRAALGLKNFPDSQWVIGDLKEKSNAIIKKYRRMYPKARLALLSLTPPCQGMSSSNPGRGKISSAKHSDHRNTLLLEALPIINTLKPRVVVAENVAPLLNRVVTWKGKKQTVVEAFKKGLKGYDLFSGVVEMADYGIPQTRKRSILVAIHRDEPILKQLKAQKLLPWPRPTHSENPDTKSGKEKWVTAKEWFKMMGYPLLNARTKPCEPKLPLHFVPEYPKGDKRYTLVSNIPPYSGKNAYENSNCPVCKRNSIPKNVAYCPHCGEVLFSRPVVKAGNGRWRLVKGFDSSYRRMAADQPASAVMTNSNHLGSDNKIHPWQNRVLSILECADLQTVPRFYDWSWALETRHRELIRVVVGEALPPYFTYLHGKVLAEMLDGNLPKNKLSRVGVDKQERTFARTK